MYKRRRHIITRGLTRRLPIGRIHKFARKRVIHAPHLRRAIAKHAPRRSHSRAVRKPGRAPSLMLLRKLDAFGFKLAVSAVAVIAVVFFLRGFNTRMRISADNATVAALRVPYQAAGLLNGYAAAHGVPFAELFTLFCAENGFFPEKHVSYDLSGIETKYVTSFNEIKKRYDEKNIAPYYAMFANLFSELTAFPVTEPNPDEPVTIYGDSWDVERNYEGIKLHRGTDILDRENLRGRVQVVSMADGTVQAGGFDEWLGYHVVTVTASGTTLLYAHLDSVAAGVVPGGTVTAGQEIGRMGDSGGGRETFPVHLHLGISPKAAFANDDYWINPYPFLRYIENTRGL
jgi:murein DD-endopeptidase MepM/ murein hydrolase activator NlpD